MLPTNVVAVEVSVYIIILPVVLFIIMNVLTIGW